MPAEAWIGCGRLWATDNPRMYSVALYTLGCKLNQLESEAIADSFREAGFTPVSRAEEMHGPGIIIINTCTALPEYVRTAMADVPENTLRLNTLPQVLESWIKSIRFSPEGSFDFRPEEFSFHSRGYLKIQDGCDNRCTYCRVRLARGPSASLPAEDALARLRSAEESGCPEFMVTGVNITQYSHSGFDLAGLLEYLLKESDSIALRLASLEPERITERLAGVLAHLGAGRRDSAHDLRRVQGLVNRIARIDAFGREAKEEVFANFDAVLLEGRKQEFVGRAGICGRFEDN